MMNSIQYFHNVSRVVMGPGAINLAPAELKRLGAGKVMVVTDPGLMSTGMVERLEKILSDEGLQVSLFAKVEPDPRYEIAASAAEVAQAAGAEALVGIGGGSSLDIAKVASVLLTNPGPVAQFFGTDLIPSPGLPLLAIPTTAGTGSEVTPIAILSDEHEKLKKGIVSSYLFPAVALLDPELTLGLPPQVTVATGMDALIHAVESFTSVNATTITDMQAVQAMKIIFNNIRVAYCSGENLAARAAMLEGALLAGIAFANAGVTAVHAFAYPIGAEYHIPHGVANSIMLNPVMEFNMLGNLPKFAQMAAIFGQPVDGLSERDAALQALRALKDLSADLNVPAHLTEFGVKEQDIPDLAEGVMKVTRLLANNPRKMTLKDAVAIYQKAL